MKTVARRRWLLWNSFSLITEKLNIQFPASCCLFQVVAAVSDLAINTVSMS